MLCRLACRIAIPALLIGCATFAQAETAAGAEQWESSAWWLNRAVDYARKIEDAEARSHANYNLAYVLADKGDFDRALEAASEVIGPQVRVYAFGRIAKLAHEHEGKATCDKALQIARETAIPAQNISADAHMVRLYFELDRSDEAAAFAAALPGGPQKRYAYQVVADELAKEGRIDEAIAVVHDHKPATARDSGYASIAKACAETSRFDRAIELAEKVEKVKSRDAAYDYIAEKLICAERLTEGKAIALRIQDERKRFERLAHHLSASVKREQEAKSIDDAMAEAATREEKIAVGMLKLDELIEEREIEKAEALIVSLVKIVEDSPREPRVSKFGTFDDSLEIAKIKAGYLKTARLLKEAGDEAGAKDRVAKAIAAVEAVTSPSLGRVLLSSELVRSQAALGDREGAQASASLFETDLMLSNATSDVAAACILSGQVSQGMELAQDVVKQPNCAYGARRVATALIHVERFDKLAEYLPLVPDTGHDVRAFRGIAQELVKSGNVRRLDPLLANHPSDAARTQACLGAYDQLRAK